MLSTCDTSPSAFSADENDVRSVRKPVSRTVPELRWITKLMGATLPAPKSRSSVSNPRRAVVPSGRTSMPGMATFRSSAGSASASRMAVERRAKSPGRAITTVAQRCQSPDSPEAPVSMRNRSGIGTRQRSIRVPIRVRSAGSRVRDAASTTATTTIMPRAIDWKTTTGARRTAMRARITMRPEKKMALPDVSTASVTAPDTEAPPRSAWRKRVTMNNA